MENMSQVPHILRGLRAGLKLGQGKLEDWLWEGLNDPYAGCSMAITAENCAVKYGITREQSDEYALRSQQLAHKAWTSGVMKEEVVPVEIKGRKGVTLVEQDDHMRPDTTMEILAKLPTVFKKDGVVTAGNASGIVDGAAALIIAGEDAVKARGREAARPHRVVGHGRRGADDDGHGPGAGDSQGARTREALAGRSRSDRDQRGVRAAVPGGRKGAGARSRRRSTSTAARSRLGTRSGASGARILLTLLLELRRRGKKYGVASACIGGGQGIAMIVEAL